MQTAETEDQIPRIRPVCIICIFCGILHVYLVLKVRGICLGMCHINVNLRTNYNKVLISIQLSQEEKKTSRWEEMIRRIKACLVSKGSRKMEEKIDRSKITLNFFGP